MKRREFLATGALTLTGMACATNRQKDLPMTALPKRKPNVVFVFGDQWRAQATGYAGNPDVQTPHIDALASESLNFTNAISNCPACSPYRASMLTGKYPLSHGIFMNDLYLKPGVFSLAEAFKADGYDTAYIGKWHLDGHGRRNYIPPERRQGFDFWEALECTHAYNHSYYYAGDDPTIRVWDGYDAIAQTESAQRYIETRENDKPFVLLLSWGPPHNPYETAPERYKAMYNPDDVVLRPNVPEESKEEARRILAGYYAHCTALDDCVGALRRTLEEQGIADDTLFIFTSDHGDMLRSHGQAQKQRPYDESIRVPLLMHYPALLGRKGRTIDSVIDAPDLMPTMLGLCGAAVPQTVEGQNWAPALAAGKDLDCDAKLIMSVQPFGEWATSGNAREYRGLRTRRYTYTRDLNGPWLLYDNQEDPYQMVNLCDSRPELRQRLDQQLQERLDAMGDAFHPGPYYIDRWGYEVDETGTVSYSP